MNNIDRPDSLLKLPKEITTIILNSLNPSDWSTIALCCSFLYKQMIENANFGETTVARNFNSFIHRDLKISVKSEMFTFNTSNLIELKKRILDFKYQAMNNILRRPRLQASLKANFCKESYSTWYSNYFDVFETLKSIHLQANHPDINTQLKECKKLIKDLLIKEGQMGCFEILNSLKDNENEKVYHLYVCAFALVLNEQNNLEMMEALLLTYSKPFKKFNNVYHILYATIIFKHIKNQNVLKANQLIQKLEKEPYFKEIIYKTGKKLVDADTVDQALDFIEKYQIQIENQNLILSISIPESLELLLKTLLQKRHLEPAQKLTKIVKHKAWSGHLKMLIAKSLVEQNKFERAYNLLIDLNPTFFYEKYKLLAKIATSELTISNYNSKLTILKEINDKEIRNEALSSFFKFFQANQMWDGIENILTHEPIYFDDAASAYFDALIKSKTEKRAFKYISSAPPSKQDRFYSLFAITLWQNKKKQFANEALALIQCPKAKSRTLREMGIWACEKNYFEESIFILDQLKEPIDRDLLLYSLVAQYVKLHRVEQIISLVDQKANQQQERYLGIAFNQFLENKEFELGVKISNAMLRKSQMGNLINAFDRLFEGKESEKLLQMIEIISDAEIRYDFLGHYALLYANRKLFKLAKQFANKIPLLTKREEILRMF